MRTRDAVFELLLNYACQAKCPFCYNPPVTPALLRRELSFEQAAAELFKAAKGGAKRLNLHGGEPTLHEELPKMLRLARKLGFEAITLVSNGVRLGDGRYARSLAAAGLTHVRLSIHAAAPALHDAIVAVPGAFARAEKALAHLRKLGVPVGLNFVLVRDNARELAPFLRRFVLERGVADVIVYYPHERGLMALNAERAALDYPAAAAALRAGIAALAERRDALLIANVPPCVLPEHRGLLLDWERDAAEEPAGMAHPEGHSTDLLAMKDAQRNEVAACRSCELRGSCRGVEPEYRKRFGEGAFRALKGAAA